MTQTQIDPKATGEALQAQLESLGAVIAWRVGDETFATFHEAEDAAFSIAGVPFSPEAC